MNKIIIAGQTVSRIEYKGQPVVTFRMIDELHQRPAGTAKRNFSGNRDKFILNEDYSEVPFEEWDNILVVRNSSYQDENFHGGHRGKMIFITQSGYLMLVKSFNDDLAWQVQRELVKHYFIPIDTYSFIPTEKKELVRRISILESKVNDVISKIDHIAKYGNKNKTILPITEIEVSHLKRGQWYDIDDFYADSELVISKSMFSRLLTKTIKSKGLSIHRRKKKFTIL
jgi:hypothetical protein